MSRPKTKNQYFGTEVEDAIREFNLASTKVQKDIIYARKIHPALNKLAENVINTWKFWRYETTYDDLKSDLVSFLYERLPKIDQSNGKAFSYFTVSSRNFLIKRSQDLYKETINAGDLLEVDERRDLILEKTKIDYIDNLIEFFYIWIEYCDTNLMRMFKSNNDRKICDAILTIFKNNVDIELFNKKELYILIREQCKIDTQYITRVVQTLREHFYESFKKYQKHGRI